MIVLIAACTLISCGYDKHNVKVSNGNIIVAIDQKDRGYRIGDTVCIKAPYTSYEDWTIVEDDTRKDTIYFIDYTRADSTKSSLMYEYKIGVIK